MLLLWTESVHNISQCPFRFLSDSLLLLLGAMGLSLRQVVQVR